MCPNIRSQPNTRYEETAKRDRYVRWPYMAVSTSVGYDSVNDSNGIKRWAAQWQRGSAPHSSTMATRSLAWRSTVPLQGMSPNKIAKASAPNTKLSTW